MNNLCLAEDCFPQMFRNRNFSEFIAHRLLKSRVFTQPQAEFGILSDAIQCSLDLRIVRVGGTRTIALEDFFGFRRVHRVLSSFRADNPVSCDSNPLSSPMPRAIRDLTVPSGTSRISAISL